MDPRTQRMAEVLVNYSVNIQPGDWVVIQSPILGEPLAHACVEEILKAGGKPTVLFSSDDIAETILRHGSDEQLSFVSPISKVSIEECQARITILAPRNTRTMTGVDPARMAITNRANQPIMETYMQRSATGDLKWTIAAYPTHAAAQDANMSLAAYEEFVYGAGLLSDRDPVSAWKGLGARQQRLIDWISDKQTVHVSGPGTDLKVSVAGRTWLNDEGTKNFPGGEIFTGPIEDSADGHITFSYPAFYGGREVQGVQLRFERGVVVDASASTDEAYLLQMLDLDEGARRLGEFAFGTNPGIQQFTKNVLFDEKMGGTLHMALGRSYPETGGTNISALHWDMVYNLRQGSEVTVDDHVFSRNGEFVI